jgi:hypothetical protein
VGDKEREEALAEDWVELVYDPTIPAILTSDGKRVKYIGSVNTTQGKSSKPGVVTGSISMLRLPIVMVGAMRAGLSEAQTRVETYLGLPEPDPSDEPVPLDEPF